MLKLFVLTDIHYYSKKGWRGGDPYAYPRENDQLQKRESEEIFLEALDIIRADESTDIVFITGDLTKNGSRESHDEMLAHLKALKADGKRIIVLTSIHDYPEDNHPTYYDKDGVKHHDGTAYPRREVLDMYAEFGRDDAIAYYPTTGSYVVQLDDKHRLFALNDDHNNEKVRRGISPEHMEWLRTQLIDAKACGQHVIVGVHHPLIAANPICAIIGKHDMLSPRDEVLALFAEYGVPVVFTGHMHMHDIDFYQDANGVVYDVQTAALTGYPPAFRQVTFDEDNGAVDVKTIVINELSRFDLKGRSLPDYCTDTFFGFIEEILACMATDYPRFTVMANSISIRPHICRDFKWIFKPVGKFLNRLTIGKVGKWTKKESGLRSEDFEHIKDKKVVHFIVSIVEGLYSGKTDLTPDEPEYKVAMGLLAILQSVIDCLPIKLRKLTGYDSLPDVIEPLLFNNGIDSYDAVLDINCPPSPKRELPSYSSNKGPFILLTVLLLLLIFSPIIVPVGLIFTVVELIKKNRRKRHKKRMMALYEKTRLSNLPAEDNTDNKEKTAE